VDKFNLIPMLQVKWFRYKLYKVIAKDFRQKDIGVAGLSRCFICELD
jgi:hypothetical protein